MTHHRDALVLLVCIIASAAIGCPQSSPKATSESPKQAPPAKSANVSLRAEDLLPMDKTYVDIMQLAAPRRLEEISIKMTNTVSKDPDWWLAHVQKAKPGEPIDYDPRLGLTKDEFTEFLELGKQFTLQKVGRAKINVKRIAEKVLISFIDGVLDFGEIELDLSADKVRTSFEITNEKSIINANEEQRATGPFDGIEWKLSKAGNGPYEGLIIKFMLGKFQQNGRGIMTYEVKHRNATTNSHLDFIFCYDLPKI